MKPSVIITGASRGVGAATATRLSQLGANIVINARSAPALIAVAKEIESTGGQVIPVIGDVSSPQTCDNLVATAVQAFGGIDALVNNASVLTPVTRIDSGPVQDWLQNITINLLGPYQLIQMAIPHLRSRRGRVINISSGAAVTAMAGWSAYCVSKAGLNHLTAVLAEEEPEIIPIAVRPGKVDTAMQKQVRSLGANGMKPDQHAQFVSYYERGELMPPEIPARALAILALYAKDAWRGRFISWDDPEVQRFVELFAENRLMP